MYFKSAAARDAVRESLERVLVEMVEGAAAAEKAIAAEMHDGAVIPEEDRPAIFLRATTWAMSEPTVTDLDDFAPANFGLDVPERLMWEAMVQRQSIAHRPGWETLDSSNF